MKVRVIIDSTADMPPELKGTLPVVPLTVRFGDKEYIDGVTITHKEFYEKLAASDVMPATSQAAPAAFQSVFEEVAAAGDSAVVLTLSHKLSGTYQSAVIAAQDYKNIFVVDSGSVTIGTGILAELALELARAGMDAEAIARTLEQEKQKLCIVAMVDTLEYLKRGGRISKTAAFAGNLLNIKPVLSVIDGEITVLGKARGTKQACSALIQQIEKLGGADVTRPLLLGYSGTSEEPVLKFMAHGQSLWTDAQQTLRYSCVGSVIGTHADPGAVAAAFFRK